MRSQQKVVGLTFRLEKLARLGCVGSNASAPGQRIQGASLDRDSQENKDLKEVDATSLM